jgi:NADPH:quinone reductase-like Zn-dependent oxidoreductase
MKALQIVDPGQVAIREVEIPTTNAEEALIRITAAALNRRDHWIRAGKYPDIQFNSTLGSDGCGMVEAVGSPEHQHWVGKTVLINPNVNWGDNPECQAAGYQVLGMPTDGTLAEYIAVPAHRLVEKPAHLTDSEAAALPLAGLTAFRAVFNRGALQQGQKVLVTGIGGGVSQMAFLWARAAGASVSVTSGSKDKLKQMKGLGADQVYNYKEEWDRQALADQVRFDLIIDSVGGAQLNKLIKLTNPAGRIVLYGATTGLTPSLDLYRLFWNQITLCGSTMGNDQEFHQMVDFVGQHQLHPFVDSVRPFERVIEAFDRMKEVEQLGKLIVTF